MVPFPTRQIVLMSAATPRPTMRAGRAAAGGAMAMTMMACVDGASASAFVSTRAQHQHQRHHHHHQHQQQLQHQQHSMIRGRAMQTFPSLFHSPKPAPTSFLTRGGRHYFSSSSSADNTDTASPSATLPNKTGDRNGLIRHEIIADDGHPLRIYSRAPRQNANPQNNNKERSILLLHGRTWSSQPVFDLRTSDTDEKQQSTLQSLADLGFHAYALDFRGFGETTRDYDLEGGGAGYTTPRRCVSDTKCAIDWITERHNETDAAEEASANAYPNMENPTVVDTRPALLGWSQGALVAQMYAQQHGPSTLSDLILFGSIFDPKVIYPRKPLYDPRGKLISGGANAAAKPKPPEVRNTDIASLEDFTLPGTICDEAALTFSSLALAVDSVKAAWDELHEFNVCNPALIHVPTLVIVGAQDPYVSWEAQRELFERLGTEDRAMCVLPGCDHAAHILKARKMFVRGVAGFLLRKDGF